MPGPTKGVRWKMEVNEEATAEELTTKTCTYNGNTQHVTTSRSFTRFRDVLDIIYSSPLSLTNESRPPVAYYLGRAADPNTFSPTARGAFGKVIYLVLRIRHIL